MKNPDLLTERFGQNIAGVLGCFDRIVIFGTYKPICHPAAMGYQLFCAGHRLLDYEKTFANTLRLQIVAHMKEVALKENVCIRHVGARERKEALVSQMIEERGDQVGVVCILSAMESCSCFKVGKNKSKGFLELQWSSGKCLHYYVYVIDPDYGLCYLRIPTWAPFRLQFYCNGHNWLERRMRAEGVGFRKAGNCFVGIDDFARAQQLADGFDPEPLHRRMDELAERFVAIHPRWKDGLHWSIYQAEYATDIVFRSDRILPTLYQELVRTAAVEVQCSDIYGFLGKRLTEASAKEVSNRLQTLVEGTRIKHTLGKASIKMYDKQGRVLRIETTMNDITIFNHYREVKHRDGTRETKYASMRKSIYSLGALAEQMQACNQRYLQFISQWRHHTKERTDLRKVTQSTRDEKQHSYRGLNFFMKDDLEFMLAIMKGEYCVSGFSNRLLQKHLPGWSPQKIGRMLKRFRVLRLIKRAGRTYKYYLATLGRKTMVAALQLKERVILPSMARA